MSQVIGLRKARRGHSIRPPRVYLPPVVSVRLNTPGVVRVSMSPSYGYSRTDVDARASP